MCGRTFGLSKSGPRTNSAGSAVLAKASSSQVGPAQNHGFGEKWSSRGELTLLGRVFACFEICDLGFCGRASLRSG